MRPPPRVHTPEEIADARRDIKESECTGDAEVKRSAEQDIAALQDQRQQAQDSLNRLEQKQ